MKSPGWVARRLIRRQPLRYSAYAAAWLLYHTWPVLTGLLARAIFDLLAGGRAAGLNLVTLSALVAAAGAARGSFVLGGILAGAPYRFWQSALLRRNLMGVILRRPGARAVPGSVGEALSVMRDDAAAVAEISDWYFDALAAALFAAGALAVLCTVDARVTLLVFGPVVAVIAIAHGFRFRLVKARKESREAAARVAGAIGELFDGVQAIAVAGAEERALAYLERLGDQRRRAALRDRLQSLGLDGLFASVAGLGSSLVLLVAAGQMRAGSFTVGDFALFASYLMTVVEFTGFVGYLINSYRQAGVSLRRVFGLMQGAPAAELVAPPPSGRVTAVAVALAAPRLAAVAAPPSPPPGPPSGGPGRGDGLQRLDVTGLTCLHPASGRGIREISFSLEYGSLTVITGRIGAGKSTLLRALLGLLEAQAGEIRWNGRLITNPAEFMVPPRVAYTPQVPTLLSGSLRENILLGWPAGDEQVAQAVQAAVLGPDLAGFPGGLDTVVGARGMRLSGGQIQRTAAARMLVREPDLLVFDDLSSGLDPETEALLWAQLCRRPVTCLAVSHRPETLRRADQVIQL